MPTYAIKAPDGNTYQIDGPAGATQEQVQAEVLRQHPSAASSPAAKPSWLDDIGTGISKIPQQLADVAGNAIALPANLINAAVHPQQTAATISDVASKAAGILGGAVQSVRNLSPTDNQGSAPTMDTAPFNTAVAQAKQQYGTEAGIRDIIRNHPIAPALALAAIAHPTLNRLGAYDAIGNLASPVVDAAGNAISKIAPAVGDAVSDAADSVSNVMSAQRTGNAVSATMADQGVGHISGDIADTQAQVQSDAATQAQHQAAAQQAQAQADALKQQSTALQAQAEPPTPAFGDTTHLSDQGYPVRDAALSNQAAIEAQMRAADDQYRSAMDAVADDRAQSGVGVSDTPEAQALIASSQKIVQPDPVGRPSVGNVPADSAGGKLHQMLLNVLQPQEVRLTLDEADKAAAQGIQVNAQPDGSFTRTIKPSLGNVDDFRRFLGKVLDGKVDGYEAINRAQAGAMYKGVSDAMDAYVGGASAPVQANWAAGKAALAPFEKVNLGQSIVGMQPGTGVATVPAAQIPGRVLAGGRDTVNAATAVAGQSPIQSILSSQLQNAFLKAKTADQAASIVAPGTMLGDAIQGNDPLQAAVSDYLNRFKASEAAGAQAKVLSDQADQAAQMAKFHSGQADALSGDITKGAQQAIQLRQNLIDLQNTAPEDVGPKFVKIIQQANLQGKLTQAEYEAGLGLSQTAKDAFALKASRDKWLGQAAKYLGYSGATALGLEAGNVFLGHH